jgi:hypothetical protein
MCFSGAIAVSHVEATRHRPQFQVSLKHRTRHQCKSECRSLTRQCSWCRHERDLEHLSPNIASSPSDLGVKVGGAGSSEFVFPEDRNRYRYRIRVSVCLQDLQCLVCNPSYWSRGGLVPDSGAWSVDQSPERQQQRASFDIQKPRLSRVQLPSYV